MPIRQLHVGGVKFNMLYMCMRQISMRAEPVGTVKCTCTCTCILINVHRLWFIWLVAIGRAGSQVRPTR